MFHKNRNYCTEETQGQRLDFLLNKTKHCSIGVRLKIAPKTEQWKTNKCCLLSTTKAKNDLGLWGHSSMNDVSKSAPGQVHLWSRVQLNLLSCLYKPFLP